MDGASRRVAALQREADGLIVQAAKLQKGDPRLKELASRLQVVESEYSALLSAKPQAVAGHDELTALRSENSELRRRNNELEQQIATLSRWQQDSQKEMTRLESELQKWQDSINAKERKLEPRLFAAEAAIQSATNSKCDGFSDMQWFDSASQQLKEMHSRVDEVEAATARGDGLDQRLTVAEADVKKAGDLVSTRLADLERQLQTLGNPTADADSSSSENWSIELRAITDNIGEAKQLMSTAKAEVEAQSQSALRTWASSELERLKKQLAGSLQV